MKLLITGVTGSIGTYIVQYAREKGINIAQTSLHGKGGFPCNFLDQKQRTALLEKTRPTHIIHASWLTVHPSYWTSLANLHWAEATLDFHKQFLAQGGQHFLFIGSCAEYSWHQSYMVEDDSLEQPLSLYGEAKLLTSRQLLRDAEERSTKVAIARLFHPFSENENEKRVFPLVVDSLLQGKPIELRNADIYRDIYHSSEASEAIHGLSQNEAHGIFNIARGVPVHLGKFIAEAAKILGREDLLSWTQWHSDIQPGHPQILLGSNAKINPYMPVFTGFTRNLEKLIETRQKHIAQNS